MTLANKVTTGRFFLSLFYFLLLSFVAYGVFVHHRSLLLDFAFTLYVIISLGDILDGYLARKYKQVTLFGRIADPFVDKIAVCGSFVFFVTIAPLSGIFRAWFVVVVLAREFLVQGIRSAAEASGIPFPATFWGKLKAFIQNVTVGTSLVYASHFVGVLWAEWLTIGLMWLTLAITVVSGAVYVAHARKLFQGKTI